MFGGRTSRGACAFSAATTCGVCLEEGTEREMLHYYLRAGANKHSVMNLYPS